MATVIQESLAEVDLAADADKRASTLSGGMKRKLNVAMALLGNPVILLLDEPSTGMGE